MGRLAVVVDFDGTAACRDVGGGLIERFAADASWRVIDDDYENGRVGSRTAYRILEGILTGTEEEWVAYARSCSELDPGLAALARTCRERSWSLEILSDGLELYIRPMLASRGLDLPVRANRAVARRKGARIFTPHMNPLCGRCGTCKSDRVDQLAREGFRVAYVGDGYSDLCAAPKAHLLFAKSVLADHCRRRGLPFHPFETLFDVERRLRQGAP
ncbi:MAG: MtnX-like HAD-IB family phosphatase [Deferrisomatales bacterium]